MDNKKLINLAIALLIPILIALLPSGVFPFNKTKVEPGLFHHYYEIIRADTSSATTVAHYKQLSIVYNALFEHLKD